MRFEGDQLIIDLSGPLVALLLYGGFTLYGWLRGFRHIVTLAGALTLGYLLTVRGDGAVVGLVNGAWAGTVRVGGMLGDGVAEMLPATPLIAASLEAPLLLRMLVFGIVLAVGGSYVAPWSDGGLQGIGGASQLRMLGAGTGFYCALLLINALAVFWGAARPVLAADGPLATALDSLRPNPDVAGVFIMTFVGVVVFVIITRFNRLVVPDDERD
jgi:hypothetical protein